MNESLQISLTSDHVSYRRNTGGSLSGVSE